MKQEFFFYSGLPRAGGTMLASVMNQHPDLYVSPLSPTVELLYYTEKYFDEGSEAYNANPQPVAKQSVLESLPREYYKNIPKKRKTVAIIKNANFSLRVLSSWSFTAFGL